MQASCPSTEETFLPSVRIRLLFVLPNLRGGGAERITLALLRELDHTRYAVSLLVLAGPGVLSDLVPPQVHLIYPPRILRKGLLPARLVTLLHAWRQDLIVAAMEMRATFCVDFAARVLALPAVLWVHVAFGEWAKGLGRRQQRRSYHAYSGRHAVIFVSEGAQQSTAEWMGGTGKYWRSIPNLFSASSYRGTVPDSASAQLRSTFAGRPLVIGIGRLEKRKGFDLLIDSAALALRQGADFELVLLGEGEQRAALVQRAAVLGIADRVHLAGFVRDAFEWLQVASCYVLSSRLEGLPTTILESMAAGTPVVATDCPSGPAELLQGGRCGLLVPMNDPQRLSEAIVRLLGSDELRLGLSEAGRRRIADFSPDAITVRWDRVFSEALSRRARAAQPDEGRDC
jgi:glycosyltransferase involved in cell wall biosynthesis